MPTKGEMMTRLKLPAAVTAKAAHEARAEAVRLVRVYQTGEGVGKREHARVIALRARARRLEGGR